MEVYLDNGATTKVDEKVVKEMNNFFLNKYGNASSLHNKGREAKEALENSRKIIAKEINANKNEIVFTSGGTESNNLAIKGVAYLNKGKHIITTKIEHHSVHRTVEELEKEGFKASYLNVDKKGFVDLEELKNSINEDTVLVSIILANNEIGTIQDIEKIGKICKENKVLFHVDAVQALTKIDIDVKKQNIDLLSMSSHKIHGPKGVGALYVNEKIKIKKLFNGGDQENKLRAGTENIPGIVGFAKAVKIADKKDVKKMEKLRDRLIEGALEIEDSWLNGDRKKRLCNNVNLSFKYIEGEALGGYLDTKGICSSTGSACSSTNLKPSHVLTAIGLKPEEAHGSIRLTLSKYTTEKEIDYTIKQLKKIVKKLRRMSPLKNV